MFPRSPRLVSFPCFSTAPSRFLSSFPRKLRENRQFHAGSEPSLRLVWAQNQPTRSAKYRVFCGYLENPGYTWKIPGILTVSSHLGFASDFGPDQLSDTGKLESCQNGAPNTLWLPWKFPETKSAGDPLVSFLVSGNMGAGQGRRKQVPNTLSVSSPPSGRQPEIELGGTDARED